jgi:hypothetical protein
MKQLRDYIRAFNHGKEIERLTIINWLEEVEQLEYYDEYHYRAIIEALKEEIHKRRD